MFLRIVCVIVFSTSAVNGSADLIVSVGSPGSTHFDTGTPGSFKSIDSFVGRDENGPGSIDGAGVFFQLQAGVVSQVIVGVPLPTNPEDPVTYLGYFAEENLAISQSFIEPAGDAFFVNQEYQSPQGLSATPQAAKWFTLILDTTGLEAGVYQISIADPDESFYSLTNFASVNNDLTFSVASVPEPSSFCLITLAFMAGWLVIRRRRIDKRFNVEEVLSTGGMTQKS